jgi:D-lactate dehydrogenase (cytochrome)
MEELRRLPVNWFMAYFAFSIDRSCMDKIIAIHDEDMDVVVQPGVNWVNLNDTFK